MNSGFPPALDTAASGLVRARPRSSADHRGDGRRIQTAEADVPGVRGVEQQVEQPLQRRVAGHRPQAADQGHREVGRPTGDRRQGEQAGRVSPLQIVDRDQESARRS